MKMTEQRINRIKRKIQESRTRLMLNNPFFALFLMNLDFFATDIIKTISTNGKNIYFSPDYIDKLYNGELDFLLCHMVMHIVLDDISRTEDFKGEGYHHACDIINNSLLKEQGYTNDRYPHLGEIYNKVLGWVGEEINTAKELYYVLPYNVSYFDEKVRKKYMIDTDELWDYRMGEGSDFVYITGPQKYYDPLASQDRDTQKNQMETTEGAGGGGIYTGQIVQEIFKLLKGQNGSGEGELSRLEKRILLTARRSKLDWKSILADFIQEEIQDYSFTPPDRRFDDSPFFLPDFNVPEEKIKDVLFMIDTSGSISDEKIAAAYSEIRSAIEQFDTKLAGWVSFFDFEVTEPQKFESVSDLDEIEPYGGGGTSFDVIFDYVRENMKDNLPASIVIITDGDAEFPVEESAMNIPVLWLLDNYEVTPPWGKIAHME